VRDQRIEVDVHGAGVEVPELVGVPAADLLLVNDDDLTYAKIGLDPASLATAKRGLGALRPSLARALVWGALWEQVLDGTLPAQEYIEVALAGLAHEDAASIIDTVRRAVRRAATQFVAPEQRRDLAERMCAATGRMLDAAEPGSDRQLALALAHIDSAATPDRLAALAGLLTGRHRIPGLELDDDLRWQVVIRLAARGAAGEQLIAGVLAQDDTTQGRQHAARARAARPEPPAKEAAWRAAVGEPMGDGPVGADHGPASTALPNAALAATVAGFSDPDCPADLLAPYRDRYAERIVALWESHPPVEAQVLARGLFPQPSSEAVAIADAHLGRDDLPTGLRRVLVERRDDVAHALALQDVSRRAGPTGGQ
jgi:aminopeptidase N